MMMEMDALYPEYGFAGHKGYGAAKHIEAIKSMDPARSIAEHLLRILWSEMAYGTKASGENLRA